MKLNNPSFEGAIHFCLVRVRRALREKSKSSNPPLSEAAVWSLPLGGREGVKANSLCHV